jgi:hypothetical protein
MRRGSLAPSALAHAKAVAGETPVDVAAVLAEMQSFIAAASDKAASQLLQAQSPARSN